MKISACMIAKNEEKNIERCISSYKSAVDEVIVVDTGSTDKTVEIATKLGAKVFSYEWDNNFSDAKNYALDRAKGDWVIFLDADEYFDKVQSTSIRKMVGEIDKSKKYDSIACKMMNLDSETGELLDIITHVRIFKNIKEIRYTNAIHEMLLRKDKGLQAYLLTENELAIYHTGYSHNMRKIKAERNLKMLLEELEAAKERPSIYLYISDCYYGLEQWQECIDYAKLFIESGTRVVGYNVKPYHNIIDCMLKLKYSVDNIILQINTALEKFPNHPSFHFCNANIKYDLKLYDEAFAAYSKALELNEKYNDIEINSVPSNLYYIYYFMGVICEHRNDYSKALEYYVSSLKVKYDYSNAFRRMTRIIRNEKCEDIVALLNTVYCKESETHVEFLVNELAISRMGTTLVYYVGIWMKDFKKEDLSLVYMLLTNKRYEKAFNHFSSIYIKERSNWSAVLSIVCALLSSVENVSYLEDYVNSSFARIIRAFYHQNEDISLLEEDIKGYTELLNEALMLGEGTLVKDLLALQDKFEVDISVCIGNTFLENRKYAQAIEYYLQYINKTEACNEPGKYYFNIAYCYYKLNHFNSAADYFDTAMNAGYKENDIYEFIRWISNQCKNNERY